MTEKEIFNKNLEISHEFSRYVLNHPELEEKIPADAVMVFILESDPELSKYNLEMAQRQREPSQRLVFVKIKGLRPAEETRLIEPHLEFAA
jgi:hypothetical protein